ncbi:chromate transporter [Natranaerobius trueperi]|uniref:Chromate transporter n=1 Tax=Natranaerobius trueperi TaxID=759412 RepID=A0A226C0I1_9FIRM|nr:chromate transporter [Natranaerobius trueperi]
MSERTYFKLFTVFLRIGAFTFGGGYAMLPIIKREIVDINSWLDEDDFLNTIAVTQSVPGALAVNTAIFVGYKIKGMTGAMWSLAGVVLPSFLIILTIVAFLLNWKHHPIVEAAFNGIRPGIVGLIIASAFQIGAPFLKNNIKAIVIFLIASILSLLGVHTFLIIITFGIAGIYTLNEGEH